MSPSLCTQMGRQGDIITMTQHRGWNWLCINVNKINNNFCIVFVFLIIRTFDWLLTVATTYEGDWKSEHMPWHNLYVIRHA